ncbi:hypothetical protein EDB80DRAFT_682123 [Ilyonectria destructans]|nr:hypothetical protein EDB80DRAFT_682123 [Ilyonectria destructans]
MNRRPMRSDDIIRAIPLEDLVVSTDSSQAIFSRSDLNEARDRRQDSLWLLDVKQHGNANLVRINVRSHTVTPWWTGQRVVDSSAYARKAKRLLAVASDFVIPSEIYDISAPEKAKKFTSVNTFLRDELIFTKPEEISYQGPSEHTVNGYLHKPPSFDPTHTYPMITTPHGGPYAWWSSAYNGDIQAMAAAGYLVFYPNPRGSMSYG